MRRPHLSNIEVKNTSSSVEHEASTSKIGEDQILLQFAGRSTQDAVNMIVNGFCKEVFKELPMEFAVEAQKLLGVSLEGVSANLAVRLLDVACQELYQTKIWQIADSGCMERGG